MITLEHLRTCALFESMTDAELEEAAAIAGDVVCPAGDWLMQEGEVAAVIVVISGKLATTKQQDHGDRVVQELGPGDVFGEAPVILGSMSPVGLQAVEDARVARFEGDDFRHLVSVDDDLSRQVTRAMAERVEDLEGSTGELFTTAVTVIGDRFDPRCYEIRDFLARNRVAYRWSDPTDPEEDREPVVVLQDGARLVSPTSRELAAGVGLPVEPKEADYDVVVVGSGPTGLAAGVYGASEGLRTLLVEQFAAGGQAGTAAKIQNYLGFPGGVSGDELMRRARRQAVQFGAEIVVARRVDRLCLGTDRHTVVLDDGVEIRARVVVLATGLTWRRLEVPGVEPLTGRGVYYGAASTDALSTRGKRIHLIGGGNSAGEAAVLFAAYAEHLTLLVREEHLAQVMSNYLIDQLSIRSNVDIVLGVDIQDVQGGDRLTGIRWRDRATGTITAADTDGIYVFIGATAETDWLPPEIQRDSRGEVHSGLGIHRETWPLPRDPELLETSVPGVFAAGDVRSGSVKRVASAVGEGSLAITFAREYLASL